MQKRNILPEGSAELKAINIGLGIFAKQQMVELFHTENNFSRVLKNIVLIKGTSRRFQSDLIKIK